MTHQSMGELVGLDADLRAALAAALRDRAGRFGEDAGGEAAAHPRP